MFSIGPGSVCDVCLESFGQDLKAPCSISCGHVFCVDCLHHITRQTCPLCRLPFDPRSMVKLHIDLDSLKLVSNAADDPSPSAEQEARTLHDRISAVANAGTTEANLRALISECKAFLSGQPRSLFQDLRVSLRMIAYLCEVKSTLRSQNQTVDSLNEKLTELDGFQKRIGELEIAKKEAVSAKKRAEGEKREIQANAVQRELELTQKLNQQKELNDHLREELHNLNTPYYNEQGDYHHSGRSAGSSNSTPERHRVERAELAGLGVAEQEFLISPLPEFTSNALAADSFVGLPNEDDSAETSGGDCDSPAPFTPDEVSSNPTTAPVTPSLLSLTAPRYSDHELRASRSQSFFNRSPVSPRPVSPVIRPIQEQFPAAMPNPLERNSLLRSHLHDLLADTPPPGVSSSLPNPVEFPSTSSSYRSSPRHSMHPRSNEPSNSSLSPSPIPIPSVQPTTSVTTITSIPTHGTISQRPVLSRASSHAVAMENAQREKKRETSDRRRSDKPRDRSESLRDLTPEVTSFVSVSPNALSSPIQTSFPDSDRSRPPVPHSTKPERSPTSGSSRDAEYFSASTAGRYGSSEIERSSRAIGVPRSSSKGETQPSSSRPTKNHSQVYDVDLTSSVVPSSVSRSSSSATSPPYKSGTGSATRSSRDRDTYQYSSIGTSKGKSLTATITAASPSVAGFA
ncbi:hypothetical protein D9757_004044 [Collybiopsis confluens]|uniref:RING-type domain-containing protein n=1 Tax=Collybiopsis confluens TaxID=2823264 RepID=A0A8H5ME14_9AGAR|nr:hypothetical protein D9757_004044 [Collybiopsis confluens]